jgi:hypothetical protein
MAGKRTLMVAADTLQVHQSGANQCSVSVT